MAAPTKLALVLTAVDNFSDIANRAFSNASAKAHALAKQTAAMGSKAMSVGRDAAGIGLTLGAAFTAPLKAAMDFESQMSNVTKVVQGLDDPKNLAAFTAQMHQLTRELPIAHADLLELIAAGGRMDIPREKLAQYAKDVTKMAVAFDAKAGEIGESMAKLAVVFKMPIENINGLADAINYLDDNSISKGTEIIEVMRRMGGTAQQVGLSAQNTAALASTFLTLGSSAEVAGTASNALIRELAIATQQPKRFQEGLKVLGLSAQDLQKNMSIDPQKTILGVLDKLNNVEKSRQIEITTQLFGKEYGDDVAKLAQGVQEYRRQLGLLEKDELKGSMSREFEKRQATAAAGWQKFKNRLMEVSITLGNALLPVMSQAIAKITPFIESAAAWISQNQGLVTTLGAVVAGGAALSLTIGGISFALGGLFKSISIVSTVLGFGSSGLGFIVTTILSPKMALAKALFYLAKGASFLAPAIGLVGTAIRGVTAIMIANPIGAAVAGIVAGAYLIYNHWDGIKSFFSNMWEGVKAIFGGFVGFVTNVFQGKFLEAGKSLGKGLLNGISYFLQPIKDVFNSIMDMGRGALEWLGIVEARTTPVTNEDRTRLNKMFRDMGAGADIFALQPEANKPLSNVNPSAGGTSTQLNYQPNITITGGASPGTMDAFSDQLAAHKAEIARMVREEQAKNQRKSY